MALMVSIITFLIATIMVIAIWFSFQTETKQEVVTQRMEALQKAEHRGGISLDLQLVRDELFSAVPILHRLMMQLPWMGRLKNFVSQAGLQTKPAKIVLLSIVIGTATYIIVDEFTSFLLAMVAGILVTTLPIVVVAWKRRKRLQEFEERFPEALDLLGRAVRAGHAFTTGMEMVAKEGPEPVAGEFSASYEEQNFGLPLRDVLLNMVERVPLVDVRFFATALLVQKETGGNLGEILDELARVIRERFRIYREVKVKTAMGRLSAGILISLPILMLLALEAINPDYEKVLFSDPLGPLILGIAGGMQLFGSFIIWRIVHIEV